jgi:hypothetical protein
MRGPNESLCWDKNVHDIDTNNNNPELLALSTLEILNVDEDFVSKLKGAYSACNYFSNENIESRLRQKLRKIMTDCFDITIV